MPQNVSPSGRREVMGGLAKGLEVLRTFSRAKPHMTLSEIAARAGLPAATARRCLNTLEELGYVARNGRQFLLRPQVLEIGAVYLDSWGGRPWRRPSSRSWSGHGGPPRWRGRHRRGASLARRCAPEREEPLWAGLARIPPRWAGVVGGAGTKHRTWFEKSELTRSPSHHTIAD